MNANVVLQQYSELASDYPGGDIPDSMTLHREAVISYGDAMAFLSVSNSPDCGWVHVYEGLETPATLVMNGYHPTSRHYPADISIQNDPQPVDDFEALAHLNPSLITIGAKLEQSSDQALSQLGSIVAQFADIEPANIEEFSGTVDGTYHAFHNRLYSPTLEPSIAFEENIKAHCQLATHTELKYPRLFGWGTNTNGNFVAIMNHTAFEDAAGDVGRRLAVDVETVFSRVGFVIDETTGKLSITETLREKPAFPQLLDPSLPFDRGPHIRPYTDAVYEPSHDLTETEGTEKVVAFLRKLSGVSVKLSDIFSS